MSVFILKANKTYTQKECLDLCFDLNYIENSNCSCRTSLGKAYQECALNGTKWNDCAWMYLAKFYENDSYGKCSAYCPLECDSIKYSITASYMDFPLTGPINLTDPSNTVFNNLTTYQQVSRCFFSIKIYYNDMRYTEISQQAKMVISDLISGLGGEFGLFIGVSFLSFIETVELFLEVLINLYFLMKKKTISFF